MALDGGLSSDFEQLRCHVDLTDVETIMTSIFQSKKPIHTGGNIISGTLDPNPQAAQSHVFFNVSDAANIKIARPA